MSKTRKIAVALTLTVAFCFALIWWVQAGPEAGPLDPVTKIWAIFNLRNKNMATSIPIWQITQEGTAKSVEWVDHAPNPRFAIYDAGTPGNETDDVVLDKETGLVWERTPSTETMGWYSAITNCYRKYLGGRKGWRLPTVEELSSLVDPNEAPLTLPSGHPFINVQLGAYWSSNTIAEATADAWYVEFTLGNQNNAGKDDGSLYIWCVRGGQGHDGY